MIKKIKTLCAMTLGVVAFNNTTQAQVILEEIPSDTNWLLRVDAPALFSTNIWTELLSGQIDDQLAQVDMPIPMDLRSLIENIQSITVHGASFDGMDGVLILEGNEQLSAAINGMLLAFQLPSDQEAAKEGILSFQVEPFPIYKFEEEIYIAQFSENEFAVSKSVDRLNHVYAVIQGEEASLVGSENLSGFDFTDGAFFFVGATEGFSDNLELPPQARVVKMLSGVQCRLAEEDTNIIIDLTLISKTELLAKQLVNILKGTIALATLTDTGDNELMGLTRMIEYNSDGLNVNLTARVPVELLREAIEGEKFDQLLGEDAIGGQKLALNIIESTLEKNSSIQSLFDHDLSTRWAARGPGQWIRIELSDITTIDDLQLAWYKGDKRQRDYSIESSVDGVSWTELMTAKSSGQSVRLESNHLASVSAKWLQINFLTDDAMTWNSLTQLELSGDDPEIQSAFSSLDKLSQVENILDANYDTRWSSKAEGCYVLFELDKVMLVQEAGIAWYKGNSRKNRVELQVSLDGKEWETVLKYEGSGRSLEVEKANTIDRPARWVKLIGHGNSNDDWTSISQFELYGKPVDSTKSK